MPDSAFGFFREEQRGLKPFQVGLFDDLPGNFICKSERKRPLAASRRVFPMLESEGRS